MPRGLRLPVRIAVHAAPTPRVQGRGDWAVLSVPRRQDLRPQALTDQARDLTGLGVASQRGLREQLVTVERDLEPAP